MLGSIVSGTSGYFVQVITVMVLLDEEIYQVANKRDENLSGPIILSLVGIFWGRGNSLKFFNQFKGRKVEARPSEIMHSVSALISI